MSYERFSYATGLLCLVLSSCNGGPASSPVGERAPIPSETRIAAQASVLPSAVSAPADTPELSKGSTGAPLALEADGRKVILGAPKAYENLTLFPLLADASPNEGKNRPLDEAMDKGALTVRELESQTVPTLRVKNSGDKPVFIMTGEIVTGAKQDRMSAHDVLIPKESRELALPVYCVEEGRWQETSRQFASGKIAGTTSLRKNAAKKSSQGTIWSKVREKSGEAEVHSDTGAMQAVFNDPNVKAKAAAFEKELGPWARDQKEMVGFAAAIDGRVVSADLFSERALLQALFPKLVHAAAIDALTSTSKAAKSPASDEVKAFLVRGISAKRTETQTPGLGKEYLIEADNDQSGTVLIYNNEIIHLSLFGAERQNTPRALRVEPTPNQALSSVSSSHREMDFLALQSNASGRRAGSKDNPNFVKGSKSTKNDIEDEGPVKAHKRPETISEAKPRSKISGTRKSSVEPIKKKAAFKGSDPW